MKNWSRKPGMGLDSAVGIAAMTGIVAALAGSGCGRSERAPDAAESNRPAPQAVVQPPAAPASPLPRSPAPDVAAPQPPEDAPTLAEAHPSLASGALSQARLMTLPDGILLQAAGLAITETDVADALAQAPPELREQMRRHALLILEQQATEPLLVLQARQRLGDGLSEEQLLQRHFEDLTSEASVTEPEVEAFYNQNSAMMGGAPLAQIAPRIREHLLMEKRQELVGRHVRDLGRDLVIGLSSEWVGAQAALAMDNPVDQARASGKPTFASFGADSCMPCQMMAPFRDEIREQYGEALNVVYVHVNKDQLLASRYGVQGIPHVVFFDAEGREVHAHTGFMTLEQIKDWLGRIGVPEA